MVRCLCLGSNEARLVFFKQNQGRSSCLMSSFLKKWAYTRMSHALQKKNELNGFENLVDVDYHTFYQ